MKTALLINLICEKRQVSSQGEMLVQWEAFQKIGDTRACLNIQRMINREARFEDAGYKGDIGDKRSSKVFKKM